MWTKMFWVTSWATFSQTHLVTLVPTVDPIFAVKSKYVNLFKVNRGWQNYEHM
jgi:hypothetical protein